MPLKSVIAAVLCSVSLHAHALDDQWYVGLGGGLSVLTPVTDDADIERVDDQSTVGTLILGRDFDDRSSGQFQLSSLGSSELSNGDTVTYAAAEAGLLYRFYDSRDNQRGGGIFGASFYGRFGLGYLLRESDQELDNEAPVYFGAGAGVETYITNSLGIRAELQYFDSDVMTGTLAVVGRFGGLRRDLARRPPPIDNQVAAFPESSDQTQLSTAPQTTQLPNTYQAPGQGATPRSPTSTNLPETYQAPQTPQTPSVRANSNTLLSVEPLAGSTPQGIGSIQDSDGDKVLNERDQCPQSPSGFPVDSTGCPALKGDIMDVEYQSDSISLAGATNSSLDYLASLLTQYPQARIELHVHTDNSGSPTDQARRSRGRLRSIGLYLIDKGVRSRQLVLRSFAAEKSVYDNNTPAGRRANNRIEIIESPH